MPQFHIRIADDDLVFSAAHFITLDDDICERLHGHTYCVAAEVYGPLGKDQYVVDFLAVRGALRAIIAELDHRVLLPTKHTAIRVSARAGQVEAAFSDRRWSFPEDDCLLLPVANTTTELLAQYVGERLLAALTALGGGSLTLVKIEVGEGGGASAVCELG